VFLKIVYHGPRAMEELVVYDLLFVFGIFGGSSGMMYDVFKLLVEAKQYGARAALFGWKINNFEYQLTFVRYLRAIADGQIALEEVVRAYHGELDKLWIKLYRELKADLELTMIAMSYAGSGASVSLAKTPKKKSPNTSPSPSK